MKLPHLLPALLCALSVAAGAGAEPRWTVIHSESMTVMGDQSANTLRDVALELEQFRAILGRLSSNGQPAPAAPTLVYVFGTRKAFEPFLPLHNGKPAQVGGYFQRNVDTNTIALSTEGFADDAAVVFHEYSHLLVGTAVRSIPVWLNEGLAEYFSTFRLKSGGKGANIGLAIARHVQLLRQRFIPLSQLLAVDQSSELYNEGERRSIFYAESWALTHYLMTELPNGPALINQYASAIAGGAAPEQAFAATFGLAPAAFEPKLRDYLRGLTFKAWVYTFDERLQKTAPIPEQILTPAEAEAWLGDLQLRIQRTGEAARRIESAAAAAPDNAAAQLMLARLRLSQDRDEEAWPPLEKALGLAPEDFAIQYRAGVASLQYLERAPAAKQTDLERQAHDALAKAAELQSNSPDTFAWLAYASLRQRAWDDAARAIARAIGLAPGRVEFRIRQADIMILRGSPNVARPMLTEIAARSADKLAADSARRRLEALDAAMVPRTAAAATAAVAGDAPAAPRRTASRIRLDLRRVQDGEQRAFGRLTAVECIAGRVQFHVTAEGRDLVTAAAQFADVDLVRFTESKETTLSCGARTVSDPVYVTWRADKPKSWPDALAGVAVALEFLPADFVP
jgi:tetratricopeptide (TPR) repeat protein